MKDDRVYLFHIQDALRQIHDYARDGESVFTIQDNLPPFEQQVVDILKALERKKGSKTN
ncbi:MAG: hypothetical protein LC725_09995 [Lentisphaerae bacterium]|nr:hypothetical protein [Lentisphaerota bacterium]